MYELLVLSLLMHWPLHGYLLAEIANHIIGPHEHISRGTLSSLLTKLEQGKMITPADPALVPFPTDRPARAFAITDTGRERFYELMMDTASYQGGYQRIFRIKALHLELLPKEDQLMLVRQYIQYCQAGLTYQKTQAQDFATNPAKQTPTDFFRRTALSLMELVAQQWQLELTWAEQLKEHINITQRNGDNTHV